MNSNLIKSGRFFSGLSQKELAEQLGQSQNAVSKYEKGSLIPSPATARKIKEVFASHGVGNRELRYLKEIFNGE